MDKRQLIEAIQLLNPSAQTTFLEQFNSGDLQQYLDFLKAAEGKRVHVNAFVRRRPDRLAS
jgi:hypothetical protein